MGRVTLIIILLLFMFIFNNLYGQATDSSVVEEDTEYTPGDPGDVVDLTAEAIEIKLEPDRPLVQIMSVRLKPEFDDINLEKSFIPELLGKGEEISVFEKKEDEYEELEVINRDKMINKKR